MRFRRFRVFLTLTIFLLLGLYYLSDTRGWGGRPPITLKNAKPSFGLTSNHEDVGPNNDKGSVLKNARPDDPDQIALPGSEVKGGKAKGSDKEKGDALEFPHKKPPEGPDIDVKLPKGKHDKHTATSTFGPIHFTPSPEFFHIPDKSIIPLPTGQPKAIPQIQHNFARETSIERKSRVTKLKRLKRTFLKHWAGYKEHAWDHDELRPVSGGYQDPFAGWRATLVDTLDMLWIMDLKDEFEEAVEEVANIDFTTTPRDSLPLFEVVIRYLGGLIAAYDISEGKYTVLLDKAKELAEVLMPAFDTPNRMPVTNYRWKPDALGYPRAAAAGTVLAEIGSLNMEFIRLAQITKNNKYYDAVARITDALEAFQNHTKIPGLWPLSIDATGGCAIGDLQKELVEASTGTKIENAGTSAEKDAGRKMKDMVKDDSSVLSKPEVGDILEQKDRSSFDEEKASGTLKKALHKDSSSLEDSNDLVADFKADKGETKLPSSLLHEKRAPPRYADDPSKHKDAPLVSEVESGKDKKLSSSDRDRTLSDTATHKDKSSSGEDDGTDQPKQLGIVGKSPKKPSLDLTKYKDQSSFGEDEAPEIQQPGSTDKSGEGSSNAKAKGKDLSSFSEDDELGDEVVNHHDDPKSTNQAVRQKDKYFFGDDIGSERKRPSSKEPANAGGHERQKTSEKATSKHGQDEDEDEDVKPRLRQNKPMHKCVRNGLRSQYGEHGIDKFTLGGMADSVYEYLPKAYLLLGGLENQYRRMHETAMPAVKDYLLFRAMTNETKRPVYFTGDYSSQGNYNENIERIDGTFTPHTGHLTCFQGAFIGLAGRAFKNEKDVDLARKLTDGCVWAYEQTITGIMPELLDMVPCANLTGSCKFDQTLWWEKIDPHAEEKVKINIKLIDEAKAEQNHESDPSKSSKRSLDSLIERFFPPTKTVDNAVGIEMKNERDADALPKKTSSDPLWADGFTPADSFKLERRRPPNQPHPQDPEEAHSSLMSQPTTVPDLMNKVTKNQHLAPGITKMQAREYILRPEAIESVFYMYRITGDGYWRDKGWQMFESIDNATSTEYGNSAISDVTVGDDTRRDKAESFWTAETLKYFWLLFSEPNKVSLDDWVFNTEAHPFRRPDLDVKREREAEQMRRRKGMGGNMVWDLD